MDVVSISVAKNQVKDIIEQGSTTTGDLIGQDPNDETGGLITAGTIAGLDETLKLNNHAAPAKVVGDKFAELESDIASKQNTLTAGNNITISGNTISASGGMTDAERQRLNLLEEAVKGKLYTEQTVTQDGNQTVPNALSKAVLCEVGGKTVVWNQLNGNSEKTASKNGITCTKNTDGSWTVNGTASEYTSILVHRYANNYVSGHKILVGSDVKNSYSGAGVYPNGRMESMDGKKNTIFTSAFNTVIVIAEGYTADNLIFKPYIIDLTQMFGAGNEPTDVTDSRIKAIEAYADAHPEYNAGELVSADVVKVESKGRNLFDKSEECTHFALMGNGLVGIENSFTSYVIPIFGGKTYTLSRLNKRMTRFRIGITKEYPSAGISYNYYGTLGTASDLLLNVSVQTSNDDRYAIVVLSNANEVPIESDGIMLVESSSVTDYAPYRTPIDYPIPSAVRTAYPLRSAGTVHDIYEFDGEKWWFVKRVGSVDLGAISWAKNETYNYVSASIADMNVAASTGSENVLCHKFETVKYIDRGNYSNTVITVVNSSNSVQIRNTTDTTILNGVTAYYELAEPTRTDITSLMNWNAEMSVEAYGSVNFIQSSTEWDVPNSVAYLVRTT